MANESKIYTRLGFVKKREHIVHTPSPAMSEFVVPTSLHGILGSVTIQQQQCQFFECFGGTEWTAV